VESRRGRFVAYDEQGRGYEIRFRVDSMDNDVSREQGSESKLKAELWTDKGEVVKRIRKGEYRITQSGVLLRSDATGSL
jgi:hypothetical protein